MGRILSARYVGQPHPHLTGRPAGMVVSTTAKPAGRQTRVKLDPPRPNRRQGPTFEDMAWTFLRALLAWARDGFRMASKKVYRDRLAICRRCELWQGRARFGLGKCGHKSCGCTKGKLAVASQACPLGKWRALKPGEA